MITFNITWHLLLIVIIQILMICRYFYITYTEKGGGYFGKGFASAMAFFFYGSISIVMWLIYGGIVWW